MAGCCVTSIQPAHRLFLLLYTFSIRQCHATCLVLKSWLLHGFMCSKNARNPTSSWSPSPQICTTESWCARSTEVRFSLDSQLQSLADHALTSFDDHTGGSFIITDNQGAIIETQKQFKKHVYCKRCHQENCQCLLKKKENVSRCRDAQCSGPSFLTNIFASLVVQGDKSYTCAE